MDDNTQRIMLSSANEHWNSPRVIVDPLHKHWGNVELDPCSNPGSIVNASHSYCGPGIDVDGLQASWQMGGLVYVNPPYGRKIKPWIIKCRDEGESARLLNTGTEIILLGPARTDTKFFQKIVLPTADSVLLWEGRLTFGGAPAPAVFPSFLAYWGHNKAKFKLAYVGKGWFIT